LDWGLLGPRGSESEQGIEREREREKEIGIEREVLSWDWFVGGFIPIRAIR